MSTPPGPIGETRSRGSPPVEASHATTHSPVGRRAVKTVAASPAKATAGTIVHRDVKPANVFVVETPVTNVYVKLLDFGVAKLLTPQGPALTSIDAILGSAPYIAPEQIRGEAIDGKTDIFALGITLYEMLAGRRPFVAATDESVMVAILRGGPIAPLVGVPRELEAVRRQHVGRAPRGRAGGGRGLWELCADGQYVRVQRVFRSEQRRVAGERDL